MSLKPIAISYLRVSTARQGASGLGLEAQRQAVSDFAASRHLNILAEYVEVESGRKDERPRLADAIGHARRTGSTLLIAKIDRLARSVAFVSSLMDAGVDFIAADMPDANRFVLHIMAAVAEYEREQTSFRTKAALAAAKARGVRLGVHSQVLKIQAIEEAYHFAQSVEIPIKQAVQDGAKTVRAVAQLLNDRGVLSREGRAWGPSNTARALGRLGLSLNP